MKRAALTASLAAGLVLLWVAAPALSLRPYRPEPVDFSLLAPHPDGLTSEPVRAPRRFNLVGLTWSGGAREPRVEVRTRADGGAWSRWTPLSADPDHGPDANGEPDANGNPDARDEPIAARSSSPTWAGEADWVQYRTDEPLGGVRLRFVNVRGTATALERARTGLRRTVSSAVTSVAGIARPAAAEAGGPLPPIVRRAAWGARDCPPRSVPDLGEVRAAYVHHTVNANDYTREEAPAVVLAICRYHRNTNGWNDIGYNFLVDRFGTLYEGRAGGIDRPVVGAQAQGYNAQTTGIANLGTFTSVSQTPAALRAMAALIRWKLPVEGSPTGGTTRLRSAGGSTNRFPAGRDVTVPRVMGHRDTGRTACPGNSLYAQLPELRRLVGNIGPGGTSTRLTGRVTARRATVRYGRTAGVAGSLSVGGGPPGAQLPVEVQAYVRSSWRTVARASTDTLGNFSATVKPRRRRLLRVRFAGAAPLRASTSRRFAVNVRPVVRLSRRRSRVAAGSAFAYRGRVRPRKRHVYQVLQQRRRGRYRKVGVKRLRTTRSGRFRGGFVPARSEVYRFYVAAKRDRSTARGATRRYRVRVTRSRSGGARAARR